MQLAVVIPAFNEAATIGQVVREVPRNIPDVDTTDIIVVDDGSTDDTAEIARNSGAHVLSLPTNQGNGAAVTAGVAHALTRGADLLVTIDADGQFNPQDISQLVKPLLMGNAEFVTCSRFARKDMTPQMPHIKFWGNWAVTAMTNFIAGTKLTDSSCGFRAYTRETALKMNVFSTFDYAQEALIALAAHGVRLEEMALPVRGVREFGQSRIAGNLFRFTGKCLSTLLRAMRDFRPLLFFGSVGVSFFVVGFALGAWVLCHWFLTGETHPYTSFLTGSAVGLLMGVALFALALLADSLGRQRRILEELLFLAKVQRQSSVQEDTRSPRTVSSGARRNKSTTHEYPNEDIVFSSGNARTETAEI